MLELMWSLLLTVAGFKLCWKAGELEQVDAESWLWGLRLRVLAVFVFAAALAVSADATFVALYGWLLDTLPQSGTGINRFTAQVLTGGACALFALGIPVATFDDKVPWLSGARWRARADRFLKQWKASDLRTLR